MRKHYIILLISVLFLIFSCNNEYVFNETENVVEPVSDDSMINYLNDDYGTEKALREKFIKLAVFGDYKRSDNDISEEIKNFISTFKKNEVISKDIDSYVITKAESMNITFDDTGSVVSKDVDMIVVSEDEDIFLNIYDIVKNETEESCYVIIPNDRRFGDVLFISDSGKWEDVKDLELTQWLINSIIESIRYKMKIWNSITDEEIEYEKNKLDVSKDFTINVSRKFSYISAGKDEYTATINYDQDGIYNDVLERVYGVKNYLTGCGPTAVSIACTYFGWPEKFIERTDNGRKASLENIKKAFPEQADWDGTYDWDAIRNGKNNFQTAALLFNMGELMNAEYSTSGTGTVIYETNNVLDKLGFKYSYYYTRNPTSTNILMKNIVKSLENGKPIIIAGISSSSGHGYVADGGKIITKCNKITAYTVGKNITQKEIGSEETNEIYLHLNLGWGGANNGWYDPNCVTYNKYVSMYFYYNITK